MRNEAEYPITNGEILGAMDRAIIDSKVKNSGLIPDMTTYLLTIARKIVLRNMRVDHGKRKSDWFNNKGADDQPA